MPKSAEPPTAEQKGAKRPSSKKTGTARPDTRLALIEAGISIVLQKGFNNTGIEEVLKSVGVPKGSFYYYFESKHAFGLSMIDYYEDAYKRKLDNYFKDETLSPLTRLRRFFRDGRHDMMTGCGRRACLFGNLAQEMADQDEVFRERLEGIFREWCAYISECIREAQERGEIPRRFNPDQLGEFMMCSWEGAIMRTKVAQSVQPLENFIYVIFEELLLSG